MKEGGINLVNIDSKLKALQIKHILNLLHGDFAKWHSFAIYWIGHQLSKFKPDFGSNLLPHALESSSFYASCLKVFHEYINMLDGIDSQESGSKSAIECSGSQISHESSRLNGSVNDTCTKRGFLSASEPAVGVVADSPNHSPLKGGNQTTLNRQAQLIRPQPDYAENSSLEGGPGIAIGGRTKGGAPSLSPRGGSPIQCIAGGNLGQGIYGGSSEGVVAGRPERGGSLGQDISGGISEGVVAGRLERGGSLSRGILGGSSKGEVADCLEKVLCNPIDRKALTSRVDMSREVSSVNVPPRKTSNIVSGDVSGNKTLSKISRSTQSDTESKNGVGVKDISVSLKPTKFIYSLL